MSSHLNALSILKIAYHTFYDTRYIRQQSITTIFSIDHTLILELKTLSCRDACCDFDYVVKGETEEEVIRNAAEHDMKEHRKTQEGMTQMRAKLRAATRTS